MMKSLCVFVFILVHLGTILCQSEANDYVPAILDPPNCGERTDLVIIRESPESSDGRVVGGHRALRDAFPWMALLGYHSRLGHQWGCGGSLISQRHVLTSGHCIYNRERNLYVVRLGELDFGREDDGTNPIDFLIKKMIVHEEYDVSYKTNDIGLLILQRDVTFTRSIHPICIPKGKWRNASLAEHGVPQVAGWGRTSYGGELATHLQVVDLPLLDNAVCRRAFRAYKGRVIDERVKCVGALEGGKDSCDGDSGGPLMHILDGSFYVTGLVSYGLQCAVKDRPAIYTNVAYFQPWIEQKLLGHTMG